MSSYVQSASASPGGSSKAFAGDNTAGNMLVASFCAFSGTLPSAVTDSQGNTWVLVSGSVTAAAAINIFVAFNCAAGANTVSYTGLAGAGGGDAAMIAEYAAPAAGTGFNLFAMAGGIGQNFPDTGHGYTVGATASVVIMAAYDKSTSHAWTGVNSTVREDQHPLALGSMALADGDNSTVTGGTQFAISGGGVNTVGVNIIVFAAGGGGGGSTAANPLGGYIG